LCAAALLAAACLPAQSVGADDGTSSVDARPIERQAWQQRRADFARMVQGAREGNPQDKQAVQVVLSQFESQAFARTPMENLEIVGVYYLPKEGIDPGLARVVANLVLGWYDALRFGTEAGRTEILRNEDFFKKAFLLGGADIPTRASRFLQDHPERAAQLVAQGIGLAEAARETSSYDRRWPSAYGLERQVCARPPCAAAPALPREQWDGAWAEAKRRVAVYFGAGWPPR
jgi:hypothetical protein